MNASLLKIARLEKSFGPVRVLQGIDLDMARGEAIGLIGENGAGKSTLMNIVSGALQPSVGSLAFEGREIVIESVRHGRELGIRFVHQELSIIGALSIAENMFLGDYKSGRSGFINRRELAVATRAVLERVGLAHLDPWMEAGRLRSGEQQLIEIAKAIVERPKLLILDEPTSSLTPVEAQRLFDLVRELRAEGVGVIFITHRLEEALENCGRVVVLRDGVLISDRKTSETSKSQLILDMVGKTATFAYRGGTRTPGATRLSVKGLADEDHLSPIDMEVRAGEVVGLFGLMGSGRTEFLETLYGYRRARCGEVWLDGTLLSRAGADKSVASGLFMLPEGRKIQGILPTHSVQSNITIARLPALTRLGFVAEGAEKADAARMARSLNIRMGDIRQPITSLSGGNQQKALFARALLAEPKVLLLDEPTHGVDVGAKAEIYDIVHRFAESGAGVLFASSELPEIMALADRCVVFAGGRVAGVLERAAMTEDAILHLAFDFSQGGQAAAPMPVGPT
ncbi:ABC-type sugar transport system ATPase subunit [Kaistia hirudinis]|uniref:ABC-type sugar transport system ATPase subunit n=1 Tax=Kaistia hirudinis TaxID=1293440 RepID=A0A840AM13_9HYPH|nr:sugar ABC transporter ATP-binding protein [Kaistia hirudinis]MBB3930304.1 ABC-type sugar transport system ATPase subunit [Kaistia hirudinis]